MSRDPGILLFRTNRREIIENGKPPERTGRKARGLKRRRRHARPAAMDFDLPERKENETMAKMRRRGWALLMTLVMVLGLLPTSALAVDAYYKSVYTDEDGISIELSRDMKGVLEYDLCVTVVKNGVQVAKETYDDVAPTLTRLTVETGGDFLVSYSDLDGVTVIGGLMTITNPGDMHYLTINLVTATTAHDAQEVQVDKTLELTGQLAQKPVPDTMVTRTEWVSGDKDIATVSDTGVVTGKAIGRTTITYQYWVDKFDEPCTETWELEVLPPDGVEQSNGLLQIGKTDRKTYEYHLSDRALEQMLIQEGFSSDVQVSSVTLRFSNDVTPLVDFLLMTQVAGDVRSASVIATYNQDAAAPAGIEALEIKIHTGETGDQTLVIPADQLQATLYADKWIDFYELELEVPPAEDRHCVTFWYQALENAHYEVYAVRYVADGESLGDAMPADPPTSNLGAQFVSWEKDSSDGSGDVFDADTVVTSDCNVYARKVTAEGGTEYHVMNRSGELIERFGALYEEQNPQSTASDICIEKISVYSKDGSKETNPDWGFNGWNNGPEQDWYMVFNDRFQGTRVPVRDFGGIRLIGTVNGQPFQATVDKELLNLKVVSDPSHATFDSIIEIYLKELPEEPQPPVTGNGLSINKTADSKTVTPGSNLSYTIAVTNVNEEAKTVTVVDTLPSEVSFVSDDSNGTYDAASHTVTWTVEVPAEGQTAIRLTVKVNDTCTVGDTITNTVTIQGSDEPDDTHDETVTVVDTVYDYKVRYELIKRVDGNPVGKIEHVYSKISYTASSAPSVQTVWTGEKGSVDHTDGTYTKASAWSNEAAYSNNKPLASGELEYTVKYYQDTYTVGTLTITKRFTGNLNGAETDFNDFSIVVSDDTGEIKTLNLKDSGAKQSKGTYVWTLKNLAEGTYTVTENNASVPGYTWTVSASGYDAETTPVVNASSASYEVTVDPNGTASTLSITNNYAMDNLTVILDGGAHGLVVDPQVGKVEDAVVSYSRRYNDGDESYYWAWIKDPVAGESRVEYAFNVQDLSVSRTMNNGVPTVDVDDGWESDGKFYSADYHDGDQAFTSLRAAAEYMLDNGLKTITFKPVYTNDSDGGNGGSGGGNGGGNGGGSTDIPDEGTPTTDLPDEGTPTTDLPDEGTPTTELPEEEVPMAEVPKTGDNMTAWILAAGVSGLGLVWLAISGKKRSENKA